MGMRVIFVAEVAEDEANIRLKCGRFPRIPRFTGGTALRREEISAKLRVPGGGKQRRDEPPKVTASSNADNINTTTPRHIYDNTTHRANTFLYTLFDASNIQLAAIIKTS